MRYDAELVDSLAAEYVLGTLRGRARRRFLRLMTDRADVRFAVWQWERRLGDLALSVRPKQPRRRVWKNICRRIESSQRAPGLLERWSGLWVALPTAVAAAWLAVAILPTPGVDRIAVFTDEDAATLWVISADLDTGRLQTEAINAAAPDGDLDYELWILPDEGNPKSLGVLPITAGAIETEISPQLIAALTDAGRLAISLEPSGGSPTGLPTGPVVHVTSVVTR